MKRYNGIHDLKPGDYIKIESLDPTATYVYKGNGYIQSLNTRFEPYLNMPYGCYYSHC